MNFNFPDNKLIDKGTICNRIGTSTFGELINIAIPVDNQISIDGTDFYFTYLKGADPGNKGGNSIILNLYASQEIDLDNLEYGVPDLVLKISKFRNSINPLFPNKKQKRFEKEIEALRKCNDEPFQNVIKIFHNGICKIKSSNNRFYDEHLYYTMEYAEYDLKSYIEAKHDELSLDEKLSLCISICEGLKELYSLEYYHRDIKPDNIFMIDGLWKIGDLGLVAERNNSDEIDGVAEKIGPIGWLSPESMNKYLCEGKGFKFKHDFIIDHQSDIFQLGKVFWYIFQNNAPVGSIKISDFLIKQSNLYSVLRTMLNHSKRRRFKNVEEVIRIMKIVEKKILMVTN
ncbi:MAG TPA: protein kinase [Bacteroidia bacterium]|nr:protein kinase [Bacteroidia bacterium]